MTLHDDELMQELLKTFYVEASDHLQTLNQALLKLERRPDEKIHNELIQEAFRAAHSLKGAARAVTLKDIEDLSHYIEEVLRLVRDGNSELTPDACDVLYNSLDGIEALIKKETPDVEGLLVALMGLVPSDEDKQDPAPKPVAKQEPAPSVPESATPAPAAPASGALTPESKFSENDDTIRVAVSKLDALMAQAGELIVTRISAEQRTNELQSIRHKMARLPRQWQDVRARLGKLDAKDEATRNLLETLDEYNQMVTDLVNDVGVLDTQLNRDSLHLGMVAEQLQDEMRRVRMIPFSTVEPLLQRTVRDAARTMDRKASLMIKGGEVELDKKVLELLKDSLLHLVRNAVGHGIESPDERTNLGKNPEGTVTIEINQRGSEAHITVSDNGRGFQVDQLKEAGKKNGVMRSEEDAISLAFLPGVTTAHDVNAIAGRGVGLDVVRQQIENLQGRITVDNRPGEGVHIQLMVPVSLAMTRVLLAQSMNTSYAIPLASVEKIIQPEHTFRVEGQTMLQVDGKPIPLVALSNVLFNKPSETEDPLVIILGAAEQRIALMVDDVLTEQELAVKPFSKPIVRARNLAGAALLGNGEPVVVLNIADIVKSARQVRMVDLAPVMSKNGAKQEEILKEHILIVDDSITTRTLEKNILKAAGYVVETATDGLEALNELRNHVIDLVVADVEMPNMDGITLTRRIRESDEYQDLPVILVTSLESKEDRERGMVAGANAYIVKRGFNQAELLSTIQQFL